MARVLASLFFAGATLALLTMVLPRSQAFDEIGMLAVVGNAYAVAAVLYRRADRLSPRMLRPALAWGSTLITAVAYFSAESPSPLVFFYLWVFLYASYFFTGRETVAQIAYVGVAYVALLAVSPPPTGTAAWWVVGMGTLVVAAIVGQREGDPCCRTQHSGDHEQDQERPQARDRGLHRALGCGRHSGP